MSLVHVRVELPAYSHSFTVQVAPSSNVRDVKLEITRICPGNPRSGGQRLVYKGRFLNDEEKIEDIWKSSDDARIVHLAVHPSAWTSAPPTVPLSVPVPSAPVPPSTQGPAPAYSHPQAERRTNAPLNASHFGPLRYVAERHQLALNALVIGKAGPDPTSQQDRELRRTMAMDALRGYGWSWPSILDESFPPGNLGEGLRYERVAVDNLPYLSLTNPNATPTAVQVHALKVLSVTLQILSMPPPSPSYFPPAPNYQYNGYQYNNNNPHTNLNEHLQQLGLPPIRLTPGQNPNPNLNPNDPNNLAPNANAVEIRAIPMRALMLPLMMLLFRTLLLMYFFSPSKRPFFALVLSAWIMYEAWGALRLVFGGEARHRDRNRRNANGPQGAQGHDQQANGQPGQGAPQQGGQARGGAAANANRSQMQAVLAGLSNLNLRTEEAALDARISARPPSLSHKIKSFVGLLLLTLYPAVWDHRRSALRRREGRLRTEANIIAAARPNPEGDTAVRSEEEVAKARALMETHQKRPLWVQRYVQRVQTTDWADDV